MNRKINLLKPVVVLLTGVLANNANAAFITFDDKNEFLSYVGSVTLDDFEGIPYAVDLTGQRSGYSWTMNDWGCPDSRGCTYRDDNPFRASGNDWVWTYNDGTFDFDFGITAFGLDYVNPHSSPNAQIALNGFSSGVNPGGSFFGIASTDGSTINQVLYEKFSDYGGFDNVVYSAAPNQTSIPEPVSAGLFGLGLLSLGLAGLQRKRVKANRF